MRGAAEAVCDHLLRDPSLPLKPDQLVLYGMSIGSVPSIHVRDPGPSSCASQI